MRSIVEFRERTVDRADSRGKMNSLPLPGFERFAGIRLFSLGRHALDAALRMLGVGKGDRVLLPEYVCRDLLAAICGVHAEPQFYPVDRSLAPTELPAAANVKAVVAINYFGFPQSLDVFRAYCLAHGAVLIEDNAHGFLSRDSDGRPLGSRGDLGVVSPRKTFAIPDGAALLVNRNDLVPRLPAPLSCRDVPLPASYVAKRALGRLQDYTGIRVRTVAEAMTRYARKLRTGHAFPKSSPEAESVIPGAPAIHCASLAMLARIDAEGEIERRRVLYREFESELCGLELDPVFTTLYEGVAPYGYPFRCAERVAASATRIARRHDFDCAKWPDLPAAVAAAAPDHYRNVYWVNFL